MRTNELIRALAADLDLRDAAPRRAVAAALALGTLGTALLFFALLGWRADIAGVLAVWRFDLKLAAALALAATALAAVVRLCDPSAAPRPALAPLLAVPALLAIGVAAELAMVPPAAWAPRWIGNNALVCLTAIPLLALPPVAALLHAMRNGAPASPTLAGAAAGLAAGGIAAALYATHCADDSPLFVATWYTLAILAVTAAAALAGRRLLRW